MFYMEMKLSFIKYKYFNTSTYFFPLFLKSWSLFNYFSLASRHVNIIIPATCQRVNSSNFKQPCSQSITGGKAVSPTQLNSIKWSWQCILGHAFVARWIVENFEKQFVHVLVQSRSHNTGNNFSDSDTCNPNILMAVNWNISYYCHIKRTIP